MSFFEPGTINVYASKMFPDTDIGICYGSKLRDHEYVFYDTCFIKMDGTATWLSGTPNDIKSRMSHPDYNGFKRVSRVEPDMLIKDTKYRVLDNGVIVAQTDRDTFIFRVLTLEERIVFGLDQPNAKPIP